MYTHTYTHAHTCSRPEANGLTHTHTHTRIHTPTQTYTHVHTDIHIHSQRPTNINTHTHTQVASKTAKRVEGIPANVAAGQAIWSPDANAILFTTFPVEPRRLGVRFCACLLPILHTLNPNPKP